MNCPLHCSTSLFFEQELCWKGACVDPLEASHRLAVTDRRCRSFHGAVCAFDGEDQFWRVTPDMYSGYSGLLSTITARHRKYVEGLVEKGEVVVEVRTRAHWDRWLARGVLSLRSVRADRDGALLHAGDHSEGGGPGEHRFAPHRRGGR